MDKVGSLTRKDSNILPMLVGPSHRPRPNPSVLPSDSLGPHVRIHPEFYPPVAFDPLEIREGKDFTQAKYFIERGVLQRW